MAEAPLKPSTVIVMSRAFASSVAVFVFVMFTRVLLTAARAAVVPAVSATLKRLTNRDAAAAASPAVKVTAVLVPVTDPSVSYTHLTLPRIERCRSRWSPYH